MNSPLRAEMRGITKRFGEFVALDNVDFDIRAGEVHALVGENGAGKSTLMRVLAGQLAASDGEFSIDGKATALRQARSSARGVGFVEQEGGLVDELTGTENLILAEGRGLGANRRSAEKRIAERAASLGLKMRTNIPAGQLPVGGAATT